MIRRGNARCRREHRARAQHTTLRQRMGRCAKQFFSFSRLSTTKQVLAYVGWGQGRDSEMWFWPHILVSLDAKRLWSDPPSGLVGLDAAM